MNGKEIMKRAVKLKKTERLPVALLSGGVWIFKRKNMSIGDSLRLHPETAAEIVAETYAEAGSDIIWTASGCYNLIIRALGGKVHLDEVGVAPDVAEALLEKAADVDKLNLDRLNEDPGIQAMLEMTRILVKNCGDQYLIANNQWGPFTLAGQLVGTSNLMRYLLRDKPAIHALQEFTTELCYRYLKLFVQAGVEMVSMSEMTASGDLISPKQFVEFVLPADTIVQKKIENEVFATMLHICGNTSRFIGEIPKIGVDMLSVDSKLDLSFARETLNGKMAFAGNVNPVSIMYEKGPEQVEAACRECVAQAGGGGGYILMPGCDLPPSVTMENVKAMTRTAHAIQMPE